MINFIKNKITEFKEYRQFIDQLTYAKNVIFKLTLAHDKLIEHVDRLEQENSELKPFKDNFQKQEQRIAELTSELKKCKHDFNSIAIEINTVKDDLSDLVLWSRKIRHNIESGHFPSPERLLEYDKAIKKSSTIQQKHKYVLKI